MGNGTDNEEREPQGSQQGRSEQPDLPGVQRAAQPTARRRTPATSARRKVTKDSEAQIKEWRARQATRAVHHPEYRAGATRPQRAPGPHPKAARNLPGNEKTPAVAARKFRQVAHDVPEGLKDPASKAGETHAASLEQLNEREGASRAKGFLTRDLPAWVRKRGSQAAAAASAMDPTLRRKVVIIGAAILLYLVVAIHFSIHFYPNSNIGTVDVGGLTTDEAAARIEDSVGDYELKVEGENGISFTVMSHEAGLSLDAQDMARQAMSGNRGMLWPIALLLPHDHTDVILASANSGSFHDKISDAVNWYNQDAEEPQNATIAYDEAERAFKIVEEKRGNTLDEDKIVQHVAEALAVMQPVLVLGDDDYAQPDVRSDDERLQQALQDAQTVLSTNVTFKAHGNGVAGLTGETAAKWVTTDEDVDMVLDEDQLNVWVQELVDKSSTVGAQRNWVREDGAQCTVEGGDYGWEADWLAVDEAVHDAVLNGKSEEVEVPMAQEAEVYNGEHGRDWKSYIDVDLGEQHAVYYDEDGKVLWQADFVSGTPDGEHDTPQGVYYVKGKESPSLLVGEANATGSPEYKTTVQYWIPWRGNDVGFHDADWQEAFGGTRYLNGFGSHGCINLSPDDVAALYKLVPEGAVVVSHGAGDERVEKMESGGASADDDESFQDEEQDLDEDRLPEEELEEELEEEEEPEEDW